ncbi:pickpocket protein 28-like [Anabrus simplex]|uniref:pickpocket protein 28-like n=1 Tax=Anabrus simplex TaxID=316456 RepID=UPI0035A2C3D0
MARNRSTPICSARRMNCKEFLSDEYLAKYHDRCQCLPSCMEVKYDVETSQVEYHWTKVKGRFKNKLWGSIFVFFKDMQIMTNKRSELYGPADFLANCGGLLGLFLGFSILSFIEIFYFLTLRLFFNLRPAR